MFFMMAQQFQAKHILGGLTKSCGTVTGAAADKWPTSYRINSRQEVRRIELESTGSPGRCVVIPPPERPLTTINLPLFVMINAGAEASSLARNMLAIPLLLAESPFPAE